MGRHTRVGLRLTTALAVSMVPLAAGPLSVSLMDTAAPAASRSGGTQTPSPQTGIDPISHVQRREDRATSFPPPQHIAPRTVIEGRLAPGTNKVRVDSPHGGHVWTASALLDHDLPAAAMTAYKNAATTEDRQDPACHLPWTLLAGIGRVESDHGRYGGSVLGSDGISRPAIIGVPLNGAGPVAAIHDTDRGRLDGDTVWDRAVGPMQFIPSTWAVAGRDGDGDGIKSPNDLNDAALAAAGYLCAGSDNLLTDAGMRAAIFRYNPSDYYVSLVMAFTRGYRTGVFVIPSPPAPDQAAEQAAQDAKKAKALAKKEREKKAAAKAAKLKAVKLKAAKAKAAKVAAKAGGTSSSSSPKASGSPAPSTGAKPSTKPSGSSSPSGSGTPSTKPSTSPSGSPSTTPSTSSSPTPSTSSSPSLTTLTGTLVQASNGWTLGGRLLDLGAAPPATTGQDYDGDQVVENLTAELTGLAQPDRVVTVQVKSGTMVVCTIEGKPYRALDGTYA